MAATRSNCDTTSMRGHERVSPARLSGGGVGRTSIVHDVSDASVLAKTQTAELWSAFLTDRSIDLSKSRVTQLDGGEVNLN